LIIGMAHEGNWPFQPGSGKSQISLRANSPRRFHNILPPASLMHQKKENQMISK